MHLLDQTTLGIAILLLLAILVVVKLIATGAILDTPRGNRTVQIVNIFNLFFLLVVNPLAAIMLITLRLPMSDPTHLTIGDPGTLMVLEIVGLSLYVGGFILMDWALITLRHNYQLGGASPRPGDRMIVAGPYKLVRHPMYTAALVIALGLACLIQSWFLYGVFCAYYWLISPLIPLEERALQKAYGKQYVVYQKTVRKLIPFAY